MYLTYFAAKINGDLPLDVECNVIELYTREKENRNFKGTHKKLIMQSFYTQKLNTLCMFM